MALLFIATIYFINNFFQTNQSRSTMILKIPVLYTSNTISFYHVVCFLIWCIFCHWTNHIRLMTSLKKLGLTTYPLMRTIFALFLWVLKILLVVLVFGGMVFSHQLELSPKVIFLCLTCLYQQYSIPMVVDSSKCLGAKIPYLTS